MADPARESDRPWIWRHRVGLVFAAVISVNLVPIWVVSALPMGDLWAHVELMDIALRYDSPHTAYAEYYRLPSSWFVPNALSLVLARCLGPLVGVDGVMRLLLSSYVIGLPLSLATLARATGRSVWLGLFGCALTYNAVVNVGFLNYLIGVPLLLFATADAVGFANCPSRARAARLLLLVLALFMTHAMLFLIATAIVVAVLLVLARRPRDLWGLLVVAPGLLAFGLWLRDLADEQGAASPLVGADGLGLRFGSVPERLAGLHQWGLSYFRDHSDDAFALAVLAIWATLLLGAVPRRRTLSQPRDDRQEVSSGAIRTWLADQVPAWLTLACLIAYFSLPSHMRFVSVIAERIVLLVFLFAALIPRGQGSGRLPAILYGLLAVLVAAYSVNVTFQFRRFERQVIGDLRDAIAALPARSRMSYVMLRFDNTVTFMGPTWHIPKGFHALDNGGVTDDSFAQTQSTPIRYKSGMAPRRVRSAVDPAMLEYDYLLTRGEPDQEAASPIQRVKQRRFEQLGWKLYRINRHRPKSGTRD